LLVNITPDGDATTNPVPIQRAPGLISPALA
jgi:hypothetical protein